MINTQKIVELVGYESNQAYINAHIALVERGRHETETACLSPNTQPNPCTTDANTIELMQRRGVQRCGAGCV